MLSEHRCQDAGSAVLAALETAARERGAVDFVLNAQLAGSGFYFKYGYTQTGDVYDIDGTAHVDMRKPV